MFKYEDISFRAVERNDLKLLLEMRYDEEINEQLFSVFPLSMENQESWLESLNNKIDYKIFIIEIENEVIGYVRLNNIDFLNRRVEVGIDISEKFRGLGYGKKSYNALINYCFSYLNIRKIYLYVFEDNEKALSVYKSCGFEVEAVLKEHIYRKGWKNVVMMSIFKKED
jgi:diamine N-acetyltransferase